MATYDNKYWLLNNIRKSFIQEDETRVCEKIMVREDFAKTCYNNTLEESKETDFKSTYHPYINDDDDDDEEDPDLVISFPNRHHHDAILDWSSENVQAPTIRFPSTKNIEWRDPEPCPSSEDIMFFPKKRLSGKNDKNAEKKSLLAELLRNGTQQKIIKCQKYSRFDGTGLVGVHSLNFKIFVTVEPDNKIFTDVCIISGTIYKDLIGLACYRISLNNANIILQPVNSYELCVADEDGDIFWGFSSLNDMNYCTLKYGRNLCLVQKSTMSSCTEETEEFAGTSATTVDSIDIQFDYDNLILMDMPIVLTYKVQMDVGYFKFIAELKVSVERIQIIPNKRSIVKMWNKMFDKKPMSLNLMHISWCEVIENNEVKVLQLTYHPTKTHEDCKSCQYIVTKYYNFTKADTPLEEIESCVNKAIKYVRKLNSGGWENYYEN